MEKHLAEVCQNHKIKIGEKSPVIADFNDTLKKANVINLPQWRSNQYVCDIRNLRDHSKNIEPSKDEVNDLINGVMKLTKTLF